MLCQFSFKNFKSYKNETVFDFQAGDLTEFKDTLIHNENSNTELLPVSVVYGPNGGGKTTLLQALSCLISCVVNPIHELKKNRKELIIQQVVNCEPYAFDDSSSNEPTEFNIYFRKNGSEYRYYIALQQDTVVSEYLYRRVLSGKKPAMIFEREGNEIKLGASINKNSINTETNPKMPYLSFLAINYNLPNIVDVQEWFESCIIRNYANPKTDMNIWLDSDPVFKNSFISALNEMGIDIKDYRYDSESKDLFLERTIGDKNYDLSFSKESEGTKKLFVSLPIIMLALAEGRLIIVDELDSKLHPKLLRYIISLFTNRNINKHGAQLIFSSHDMSTMKKEIFRRDEIWFAALDENHSSELYSLFGIRKEDGKRINSTATYDKQYLEGRYGADPYLRNMLDWENLT